MERAGPGHAAAVRPDADQPHRGQRRPLYDHRQPAQRDRPRRRHRRAPLELAPGRQRAPVGRHHRARRAERRARRVLLDGRGRGRAHLRGDAELPARGPGRPDGQSRAGLRHGRRDRHDGRPALGRATGRGEGGPGGQHVAAGDSRQRAHRLDLAAHRQRSDPGLSQRGLAHEHARRHRGVRHPLGPDALALQHGPEGGRLRRRHLAEGGRVAVGRADRHPRLGAGASGAPRRLVEVHGERRALGAGDGGRRARPVLRGHRDAHQRLLRRLSARGQPVRQLRAGARRGDRRAAVALSAHPSRALGLRHPHRPHPRGHRGRRRPHQGAGAALEAGVRVRARPRDRRARVADRGAGR